MPGTSRRRACLALALTAACAGLLGTRLWAHWVETGPVDDAYITFRVARNWAHGLGPVFNPGERVEVATSSAWTSLLAAAIALGADPLRAAAALGAACAVLGMVLAALLAGELGGQAAALGAGIALALLPHWNLWAASGMETPLAGCGLAAAALLTVRARPVLAGAAAALTCLSRPELTPVAPLLLFGLRDARPRALVAFCAPVGAAALLRWLYFGSWTPNTYVAKVAGGGLALRVDGLEYAARAALALAPLLLVAATGAGASPPRLRRALRAAVLATFVAALWSGGDHFPLARLIAPALPLLCALAAGASPIPPRWRAVPPMLAAAAVCAIAVLRGEVEALVAERHEARTCELLGRSLSNQPAGTLAAVTIGALGYYSDRRILDLVGLAEPHIARSPRLAGALRGHDHGDPAFVLERAPELVLPLTELRRTPWTVGLEKRRLAALRRYFAAGEQLISDPRFAERYDPVDVELVPSPFHVLLYRRRAR